MHAVSESQYETYNINMCLWYVIFLSQFDQWINQEIDSLVLSFLDDSIAVRLRIGLFCLGLFRPTSISKK